MIPVRGYKNCSVGVLGLSRTGIATAQALLLGGASPLSWDDNSSKREAASKAGVEIFDLNEEVNLDKIVVLIVSPGIPHLYPKPHPIVAKALKKGIVIDNDISLFFRSFATEAWSEYEIVPKVVCVTGSNGKSTTTALLTHLLSENKFPVESGGNIGQAVLSLQPGVEREIKVLEISSYQAELARTLQPDLAIFLNFSVDHFDRHAGRGGYFSAKSRLFTMGSPQKCIVGVDEIEGMFLANVMREELQSADPVISFSVESILKGDSWNIFVHKGFLSEWRNGRQVASIDLRTKANLPGKHNHQNICAAYACCRALGLSPRKIEKALESFKGLRHRAQILGKKQGILFVNDSKATNCVSASKSLNSFKNIRWIVGGEAKEPGIEALMPITKEVKGIYLIGSSEESFSIKLGETEHKRCQSLKKAIKVAFQDSSPGDTILLAPACASFDQFKSFEERGEKFIEFFESI